MSEEADTGSMSENPDHHPYPNAVAAYPTLRQSRLATFDRCALSAHIDDEYRRDWSSHPQARGTIFHRVAAKCLRTMYEEGEPTIPADVAVAILNETLRQDDEEARQGGILNLPLDQVRDLRWTVVKWATDMAFDIQNLVDIEKRLNATIRYDHPDGGWAERTLTGALDAIFVTGEDDSEAVVLDWKDTWDLPGPSDVSFNGYFQQRFYAWLVFRNYEPIERVTLREVYVRFSEPREAVVERYEMENLEAEFSAIAERFDRAYETKDWPPTPGKHCGFCPRPETCPIFPGVRGVGMIDSPEKAARVARETVVAEAVVKGHKQALSAWASVHGSADLEVSSHKGSKAWTHRETRSVKRPKREDLEMALRINGGQPLDARMLDELYPESRGTRFGLHTVSDGDLKAPDEEALMGALQESIKQRGTK